ncbi:hypothetical protein [Maliponia aquimaris]|uniref:Uncharacterized protein n=1 Tax=Maliponia aquimaris TaxID=1673631 RepID=A0A238L5F1_9RHOB|nr:hypothetical protein [Maliponia aquimaris]SMX50314.1 hypothetical protein MAA8898_04718 [Maliponia aquimaris]
MTQSNGTGPVSPLRSSTSVTVDNIIRRALRVSDPTDPEQMAKALLDRFASDAEALRRERDGTPVQLRTIVSSIAATDGAERVELAEAKSDLDRDLDALIHESQLKDIQAEMRGWATAIRLASRNGLASARLALSSGERDRSFAARRTLTDYARLSRYLAALTNAEAGLFCRLAQSCDIMGGMILVTAGEALAASGVRGTSVILQSSSNELQVRREAVMAALRGLVGSTQEAHAPNEWARGLTALRQLSRALESAGAADLRAFLDEGYLSNLFDEMIALVSGHTPDGMRALGATSIVTTAQLERFLRICRQVAEPESPQLTNFLTSIQYFVDAFGAARSGYRLVHIARPPILFYGLYGAGGPDPTTERLLRLITLRGRFAQALDCFCCNCEADAAEILTVGCKALYDIDRAVDLLVQGPSEGGLSEAEIHAAAFHFVIDAARHTIENEIETDRSVDALTGPLESIVDEQLLLPGGAAFFTDNQDERARRADTMQGILCLQRASEREWIGLLRNLSSSCRHELLLGTAVGTEPVVQTLLDDAEVRLGEMSGVELEPCGDLDISIPDQFEVSLETLVHNIPFKGLHRNRLKKST